MYKLWIGKSPTYVCKATGKTAMFETLTQAPDLYYDDPILIYVFQKQFRSPYCVR